MTSLKKKPIEFHEKSHISSTSILFSYSEKLKLKIRLFTCSLCLVLVYIVL